MIQWNSPAGTMNFGRAYGLNIRDFSYRRTSEVPAMQVRIQVWFRNLWIHRYITPFFAGICLPRNILDLFPVEESHGTYVSNLTLNELNGNNSGDLDSRDGNATASRQSTNSSKLLRANSVDSNGASHISDECLQCCRRRIDPFGVSTSSRSECFNSSESSFSDEVDRTRGSILRHAQRLANPVWSKQSRTQLLDLKQKHPSAFQDICLFSEVCQQLGKNTYRILSRRFLHELFLDIDYASFYREPREIMSNARINRLHSDESERTMNGGDAPLSPSGTKPKQSPGVMEGSSSSGVYSINSAGGSRTNYSVKSNQEASNIQSNSKEEKPRNNSPSGEVTTAGGSNSASSSNSNVNGISDSGSSSGRSVGVANNCGLHHLRSPPLASLYETSVENLVEMSSTPKETALRMQVALGQLERVS